IRGNHTNSRLLLECVEQPEGVLQGYVYPKVLTGHAEIRGFGQILIGRFLGNGQRHIVGLCGFETTPVVNLEIGRRLLRRRFGVGHLSPVAVSVDSEPVNVAGDDQSNDFNVSSKQSLEKLSAQNADAFTTVSTLTSKECKQFLKKEVDVVTPNGFEDSFVPQGKEFDKKRKAARELLLKVAGKITGEELGEDTLLLATSGRYEFRNKGLDVFTDALGKINKSGEMKRDIVAFYLIPAHHYGPIQNLRRALEEDTPFMDDSNSCLTHNLHSPEHDPILGKVMENELQNKEGNRVKIVYVPSYLHGDDGVFNLPYFDLLIGFDLTVFASYYEPWGYTPLESLAFKIPTVTTTLAGFGLWVKDEYGEVEHGISVVERDDDNYKETVDGIAEAISTIALLDEKAYQKARDEAWEISRIAEWKNLVDNYLKAYDIAISKAQRRTKLYVDMERPEFISSQIAADKPNWKKFIVNENIPPKLSKLEQIYSNLYWSWNVKATELFQSIDPEL
ncbi:hypothetical protein LCGC14_2486540, partial [marine sediment metagenome]